MEGWRGVHLQFSFGYCTLDARMGIRLGGGVFWVPDR